MTRIYKLFVMPACDKCTAVKEYLKEKGMQFEEYDLTAAKGMDSFREYYPDIKEKVTRNEDGSLVIPIMLVFDNSNMINFANKIDEVKRLVENASLQDVQ